MRNNRKWSATEESRLLYWVKVYPQNLTLAFKEASRELNRSFLACQSRWYTHLSKDPANTCFAIFSERRYGMNRKNLTNNSTKNANKSIWKQIINFIKNLK